MRRAAVWAIAGLAFLAGISILALTNRYDTSCAPSQGVCTVTDRWTGGAVAKVPGREVVLGGDACADELRAARDSAQLERRTAAYNRRTSELMRDSLTLYRDALLQAVGGNEAQDPRVWRVLVRVALERAAGKP